MTTENERLNQDLAAKRQGDYAHGTGASEPAARPPLVQPPSMASEQPGAVRLYWTGTEEQQAALVAAWAKASLDFEEIDRDTTGQIGNRNFKYAPLGNLTRATRKALAAQGIVVTQPITSASRKGRHTLSTVVMGHGAKMVSELDFMPAELVPEDGPKVDRDSNQVTNLKEWGKQTTYLRRYEYQTTFALDADADADQAPERDQSDRPAPRRAPDTAPRNDAASARQQPAAGRPQSSREPNPTNGGRQQPPPPPAGNPPARPAGNTETGSTPPDAAGRTSPGSTPPDAAGRTSPGSTPPPPPAARSGLAALDDDQLAARIRELAKALGLGRVQATELCIEVTGKETTGLDRPNQERLCAHLEKMVAGRAASENAQGGGVH